MILILVLHNKISQQRRSSLNRKNMDEYKRLFWLPRVWSLPNLLIKKCLTAYQVLQVMKWDNMIYLQYNSSMKMVFKALLIWCFFHSALVDIEGWNDTPFIEKILLNEGGIKFPIVVWAPSTWIWASSPLGVKEWTWVVARGQHGGGQDCVKSH